jgi:hypothetical protein
MARPLRIEYPGAIYHVLSRGDRREAIFRTEADRELFLDLLDQIQYENGIRRTVTFRSRVPIATEFSRTFAMRFGPKASR